MPCDPSMSPLGPPSSPPLWSDSGGEVFPKVYPPHSAQGALRAPGERSDRAPGFRWRRRQHSPLPGVGVSRVAEGTPLRAASASEACAFSLKNARKCRAVIRN